MEKVKTYILPILLVLIVVFLIPAHYKIQSGVKSHLQKLIFSEQLGDLSINFRYRGAPVELPTKDPRLLRITELLNASPYFYRNLGQQKGVLVITVTLDDRVLTSAVSPQELREDHALQSMLILFASNE